MYLGDGQSPHRPWAGPMRCGLSDRRHRASSVHMPRSIHDVFCPDQGRKCTIEATSRCSSVVTVLRSSTTAVPQHGPGRKASGTDRVGALAASIVHRHPRLHPGCLDSDGCRHRRLVNGRNYPAYAFRNRSVDILGLFTAACDLAELRWRQANHGDRLHRSSARRGTLDAIIAQTWPPPARRVISSRCHELARRYRVSDRPSRDPLVRHPHGHLDRRRALARAPSGQARGLAGRRHHHGRPVGGAGRPARRPALRGRLQLGLLRPAIRGRSSRSGRAGWPSTAASSPGRSWASGSPMEVAPARSCAGLDVVGAVVRARPGHRPLGELLQRGSVRSADRSAVEALHLAAAPAARLRAVRLLPPDLPLRVAMGPARLPPPDRWLRPRLAMGPGALFFAYIGLYSIGRFAIEALRLDSFWLGPFRVAQLASLLGVLVASSAWPGATARRHRAAPSRRSRALLNRPDVGGRRDRQPSMSIQTRARRALSLAHPVRRPPRHARAGAGRRRRAPDDAIRSDASLEQIANGATLPGIVRGRAGHAGHPPGLRLAGGRRRRHRRRRRRREPRRHRLRHQLRRAAAAHRLVGGRRRGPRMRELVRRALRATSPPVSARGPAVADADDLDRRPRRRRAPGPSSAATATSTISIASSRAAARRRRPDAVSSHAQRARAATSSALSAPATTSSS